MNHTHIEDLTQKIEIPEGGTLSRVLSKDGNIRLVGFGFDAGEELTDHSAGVPVVIQVLSGRLNVGVEGATYEMTPDSWLRLDAGVPHSVKALEPSRLLLTMIRPA
jgi:quercetin dioxygenase-like cupin family protein